MCALVIHFVLLFIWKHVGEWQGKGDNPSYAKAAVPLFSLEKFGVFCWQSQHCRIAHDIWIFLLMKSVLHHFSLEKFGDFCWQCQQCLILVLRSLKISVTSFQSWEVWRLLLTKPALPHRRVHYPRCLKISVDSASIASFQSWEVWRFLLTKPALPHCRVHCPRRLEISGAWCGNSGERQSSWWPSWKNDHGWVTSFCQRSYWTRTLHSVGPVQPDRYMHYAAAAEAASYSELWLPPGRTRHTRIVFSLAWFCLQTLVLNEEGRNKRFFNYAYESQSQYFCTVGFHRSVRTAKLVGSRQEFHREWS